MTMIFHLYHVPQADMLECRLKIPTNYSSSENPAHLTLQPHKGDQYNDVLANDPYLVAIVKRLLTRVNSANVLDEGLRIGGRGRRINSKVKIRQTRRGLVCIENKCGTQLTQSQSVPGRPLLDPI
jgi:hypothetical protein